VGRPPKIAKLSPIFRGGRDLPGRPRPPPGAGRLRPPVRPPRPGRGGGPPRGLCLTGGKGRRSACRRAWPGLPGPRPGTRSGRPSGVRAPSWCRPGLVPPARPAGVVGNTAVAGRGGDTAHGPGGSRIGRSQAQRRSGRLGRGYTHRLPPWSGTRAGASTDESPAAYWDASGVRPRTDPAVELARWLHRHPNQSDPTRQSHVSPSAVTRSAMAMSPSLPVPFPGPSWRPGARRGRVRAE
jgi:hypothetical protein